MAEIGFVRVGNQRDSPLFEIIICDGFGLQYNDMYRCASTSSLSSFENQPYRDQGKRGARCGGRDRSPQFSEFQDDWQYRQVEPIRNEGKGRDRGTEGVIAKLRQQIQQLKAQNHKLTQINITLLQQIQKQPPQPQPQSPTQSPQIPQLLHQLSRIKQSLTKTRLQSQTDKDQINALKLRVRQFERMQSEWAWKDKFIDLFVDMVGKIAEGVEPGWTEKKKIQVGWKIVKNVIDKALNAGIKVPRVQGSRSRNQKEK